LVESGQIQSANRTSHIRTIQPQFRAPTLPSRIQCCNPVGRAQCSNHRRHASARIISLSAQDNLVDPAFLLLILGFLRGAMYLTSLMLMELSCYRGPGLGRVSVTHILLYIKRFTGIGNKVCIRVVVVDIIYLVF